MDFSRFFRPDRHFFARQRCTVSSNPPRLAFISAPLPISHMFMSGCSISEIEEGRRPAPLSRKLMTSAHSVAVHLRYCQRDPVCACFFLVAFQFRSFVCLNRVIMALIQWTDCVSRYIIVCSKYFWGVSQMRTVFINFFAEVLGYLLNERSISVKETGNQVGFA